LMTSGIKRCMVSQFLTCCFLLNFLLASAPDYFPSDKKHYHIRAVKLITEMISYIWSSFVKFMLWNTLNLTQLFELVHNSQVEINIKKITCTRCCFLF
jgi:hypothetical protein